MFIRHSSAGSVILAVYIDILLTSNDTNGFEKAKAYLNAHFVTKDMGRRRYFFGVEISHSPQGVAFSQQKYALDLIKEAELLYC